MMPDPEFEARVRIAKEKIEARERLPALMRQLAIGMSIRVKPPPSLWTRIKNKIRRTP